ncbi:MAG: dUTP pyrophosphatase [Epulopiscium sp.]|nr:dUTP pyrophosphatase [Candidatus Epulonipiscium sp.]
MKEHLYFAKMRPSAVIPTKREEDGCYDIYACFDEDYIEILPHTIQLIPTGIASAFDKKYRIGIRERGSTGTKGLAYRSGQIDSGYRGEWFIPINNTTNKLIVIAKQQYVNENPFLKSSQYITLYPYEKAICQGALEQVPEIEVKEISYKKLQAIESERGSGMMGSSRK